MITNDEIKTQSQKRDFLDEIDDKSKRIFDRIYLFLAYWTILTPIGSSLFYLCGSKIELLMQGILIGVLFAIVAVFQLMFNITKFRFKKPNLFQIVASVLISSLVLSMLVAGIFGFATFLQYFSFAMIFLLFVKIDKKHYKSLAFTFIIEMTIDVVFGIIDIDRKWFPGFQDAEFAFSLQFLNSNYAAYTIVGVVVLCLYYFLKSNVKWERIVSAVSFIVLNVFLFLNGSFVAETALFIAEIVLIIYTWIKTKRFPMWLVIAFAVTFATSFIRLDGYSTSNEVYVVEAIAVIDNKLGTHILEFLTGGTIVTVAGADGWTRDGLISEALAICTENAKSIFFGHGIGYAEYYLRVHNLFIWMWLDFGILFTVAFYALAISLIVMYAKRCNKEKNKFLLVLLGVYLFMYNFGVIDFSFLFFMIYYGAFYRQTKDSELTKNINKNLD